MFGHDLYYPTGVSIPDDEDEGQPSDDDDMDGIPF